MKKYIKSAEQDIPYTEEQLLDQEIVDSIADTIYDQFVIAEDTRYRDIYKVFDWALGFYKATKDRAYLVALFTAVRNRQYDLWELQHSTDRDSYWSDELHGWAGRQHVRVYDYPLQIYRELMEKIHAEQRAGKD